MRFLIAFLLLVVLMATVAPALADGPAPDTKQDNLCYEGGAMAGKCTTEWAWVCGWYLARFYFLPATRNGLTQWNADFTPAYAVPQPFVLSTCERLYPPNIWGNK